MEQTYDECNHLDGECPLEERSNVIFTTYSKAQSALAKGKPKGERKKIANNTYLIQRDGYMAVRLHNTDVVDIYLDKLVLRTGGWMTNTTKERINRYLPVGWSLYTDRRIWYLSYFKGYGEEITKTRKRKVYGAMVAGLWVSYNTPYWEEYEHTYQPDLRDVWQFKDGISIHSDGRVYDFERSPTKMKNRSKAVKEFATEYLAKLSEGRMEAPSNSDCWYCLFKEVGTGRPMGDLSQSDHMVQHLADEYYVPSIIMNALDELGGSPIDRDYVVGRFNKVEGEVFHLYGIISEKLYRILVRYVGRKVGLGG